MFSYKRYANTYQSSPNTNASKTQKNLWFHVHKLNTDKKTARRAMMVRRASDGRAALEQETGHNRNIRTTSRGDPEYSGQKKPKWTFPFDFRPKFPESLA